MMNQRTASVLRNGNKVAIVNGPKGHVEFWANLESRGYHTNFAPQRFFYMVGFGAEKTKAYGITNDSRCPKMLEFWKANGYNFTIVEPILFAEMTAN